MKTKRRVKNSSSARWVTRGALTVGLLAAWIVVLPAQQLGTWDSPIPSEEKAIHLIALPTGKVLFWGESEVYADGTFATDARLYDPADGSLVEVETDAALFCGGHAGLSDGRILAAGGGMEGPAKGNFDVAIFDPFTESWSRVTDMTFSRWYPSLTTLADGRVLSLAGTQFDGTKATIPEIYDPPTDTWTPLLAASKILPNYPFSFVGPNGKQIVNGTGAKPYLLDTVAQTWTVLAKAPLSGGSAVMYEPGRVMKSGGLKIADKGTVVANFNDSVPAFRSVAPMQFSRCRHDLTILADGTVLAVGGKDAAKADVLAAELWNPQTETWTTLSSMHVPRTYHSTAILMKDGRVLAGGGVKVRPESLEVFNPPYLNGTRPTITSAPSVIGYGGSFEVGVASSPTVAKISLIRLGAVTHGFDQNQRFMWLNFTPGTDPLIVQEPANAQVAPPGYYMLFAISDQGVPSIAKFVKVN